MQRSWLRLLISALVILAALTAGRTNVVAAPASQPCAEMAMYHGGHNADGDHAAVPRHCDSLICGAIQLAPPIFDAAGLATQTGRAPQPHDDVIRLGVTGSPDLRPPIS